ncbi:MAG TPA: hypothetical protein VGQ83_42960 [Polyangia bacterium]|jgi:sugar lactone lactonase YvrE
MVRFRRFAAITVPLIAAALALGCGARRPPLRLGAAPKLVWPAAPEPPRVQLLGRLPAEGDALAIARPVAIAVARDERVLVTDAAEAALHVFDFEDREHRVVRAHGDRPFLAPVGVAVDDVGRSYVADAEAGLIAVFAPDEQFERRIEGLRRPTGLAIDRERGLLYCVETAAHVVRQMDLGGRELRRLGGPGTAPGRLSYPTFAAVDPRGRLLVADSLNGRVAIFEPDGRFAGVVGQPGVSSGDLARPKGVAADGEGHIYVADAVFGNVQVFDAGGALLLYLGENGAKPGQLWLPSGLAIDERDRLFVANTFNGRVDVFQYLRAPAPEASRRRASLSPEASRRRASLSTEVAR